jgi:hypothetical protein
MNRFSSVSAILSLWAIALISVAAMFGAAVLEAILTLVQARGTYSALAIFATGILGGVAGGLKHRMPNYGGRPLFSDLMKHLKAPLTTAALALMLAACVAVLLQRTPASDEWQTWALNAAGALNLGIVILCVFVSVKLVREYRRACAWEDLVHPRHTG